jgi:hypothetical protein
LNKQTLNELRQTEPRNEFNFLPDIKNKLILICDLQNLKNISDKIIYLPDEASKGKKYVYENKIALGRYFCIQKFIEKRTGLKKDVKSIASRIQLFSSIFNIEICLNIWFTSSLS